MTMQAFNLAERFRCPVFVASNKEIGMTRESIDIDSLEVPQIIERTRASENVPFLPFAAQSDDSAPDFLPIGEDTLVRQTSSTHGPDGYITTDPEVIAKTQARLTRKLVSKIHDFSFYEEAGVPDADTLVIAYGVTARAAKVAVNEANREGRRVSLLVLKTLWPVPEALIRQKAESAKQVMVVEMNLGQYVREIRRVLLDKKIDFLGQMNGNLITPRQIRRFITHA